MPSASSPSSSVASTSPHDAGVSRRTSKRRRSSSDGALEDRASITAFSPDTSHQGDGALSGTGLKRARTRFGTTTFAAGGNDAYGAWLNEVQRALQPLSWKGQAPFASYIGEQVAVTPADSDEPWTGVVSSLFVSPKFRTSPRTPSASSVRPTTDQPFSVVWHDNTDSTVDHETLLEWIENARKWGVDTLGGLRFLSDAARALTCVRVCAGDGGSPNSSSSLSPPPTVRLRRPTPSPPTPLWHFCRCLHPSGRLSRAHRGQGRAFLPRDAS